MCVCVCVFSSFAGVFTSACMLVCSFADMFGDWFLFVCYAVFVFLLFGMGFFLYVLVHVCIILICMLKCFVRMSWFNLFLCSVRFLSFVMIIFSVGIYVCVFTFLPCMYCVCCYGLFWYVLLLFGAMCCFVMSCFCLVLCFVLICFTFACLLIDCLLICLDVSIVCFNSWYAWMFRLFVLTVCMPVCLPIWVCIFASFIRHSTVNKTNFEPNYIE